jgi:hypothetical protein
MVVTGDDERNTVLDEQPVKAFPSLLVPVEAVMEDDMKERLRSIVAWPWIINTLLN